MASTRTSSLRTVGFLLLVLGALLLGIGTVLTWVTLRLAAPGLGALDQAYPGVDLWQGKVALACAMILLIGVLALRAGSTDRGRRIVAVVMVVAGFVALGVTGAALLGEATRLEDRAVQDMAATAGIGEDQVHQAADALGLESTNGAGVYLSLAGAVTAAAAAILGLAWATRRTETAEASASAEPPGSPTG
jgi:Tryptophan-associated transmembrane protein (Trp_oprn_chp)